MKRSTRSALATAALSIAATAAYAGECPADQRVADGQGQKKVTLAAKDVTDMVITHTDLSTQRVALKDHQLRARRLVIQPGGIVPWHSHEERPAMIYVVKGAIYEYASNCGVPILHRTGEVAREARGTSHWWQNTGSEAVELFVADIFPPQRKSEEKMM